MLAQAHNQDFGEKKGSKQFELFSRPVYLLWNVNKGQNSQK